MSVPPRPAVHADKPKGSKYYQSGRWVTDLSDYPEIEATSRDTHSGGWREALNEEYDEIEEDDGDLHIHVDAQGFVHRCYHHCKSVFFSLSFWAGVTLSFPIEHWLWEKCYPFNLLTKWMGI